jgi:hypothetical protein
LVDRRIVKAKGVPMAEQMRPSSKKQAPDPSRSYERSRPEDEAGMGRLEDDAAAPAPKPDRPRDAVTNHRNQSKGRRNRP